jgi:hypothetical protein
MSGGGVEEPREVPGIVSGDHGVQSSLHRGHDCRVRALPTDGGPAADLLQGRAVQLPQVPQYQSGTFVSYPSLFLLGSQDSPGCLYLGGKSFYVKTILVFPQDSLNVQYQLVAYHC